MNDPKVIWVRMLKRPDNLKHSVYSDQASPSQAAYALRGKFNSILEECLFDGKADRHQIMSIELNPQGFDLTGCPTSLGFETFWTEVFRGFTKFDKDEIKLRPRKPINQPKTDQQRSVPSNGRKLPAPPPESRSARKHSISSN